MTGYESKRAAARDKLDDDDTLTIAYQSGYYDGKKAAQTTQQPWRESASDYERGVIDGRQMQAQSSVDKAVNAMTQRPWVDLTDEQITKTYWSREPFKRPTPIGFAREIEQLLKEKNT